MKRRPNALLLSLLIFTLSIFIISCSDDDLPTLYRRSLAVMTQPGDAVSFGEKGVFELSAKDFTSGKQRVTLTFNEAHAKVWFEGTEVINGIPTLLHINNTTLRVEAEPLVDGDIKIEMSIWDDGVTVTQGITLRGSSMLYEVQLKNVPSPMHLGLRRSIDMIVYDPSEPDAVTVDYLVSAKVIKGRGVVHILNEMVWNDTIPDFEPTASQVPNAKWLMMYTGFEVGENQIEFTVENTQGRTSRSVASIWMSPSVFDLTSKPITSTPTINENEMYETQLSINAFDHQDNRFFARGYFTKGAGQIFVTGGELSVEADQLLPLNTFNPRCSVKPTTAGDLEAVVEIHDRYGTIHSTTISFTVLSDDYQVRCDYENTFFAFMQRPFDLTISGSADPLNDYKMSAEIVEGDTQAMQFRLNAADILGKGVVDIKAHETLYVVSNKAGRYKMKLTFNDKWSDAKEYFYDFTIKENLLQAIINKDQHSVVLGSNTDYAQWTSQLSVMAGDDPGLYKDMELTYTNNKEGNGVLKVNGSELVSHATASISGSMATFYYTPSAVGRHTLAFVFKLKDGRTITKTIIVDVTDSPVTLSFSCPNGILYDGESREISLLASQNSNDQDLAYRFEFLEGSGQITKKDGSALSAGTSYPLKQNDTERMNYTSGNYLGAVRIRYTVTGASQKSTQATASFKVETGLKLTISTPQNVIIGSVAPINLEITKPNYTDQFSVRYDLVKPYPTYTGAGTIEGMTEGVASDMDGGVRTLRYMPTIAGRTRLMITATDKTGKTVSNYVDFDIAAAPINLNFSCPDGVLYDGESREISLFASQKGNDQDLAYRFEFLEGSGNITKKDGTALSAGVSYPLKQENTERLNYTAGNYLGAVRIRYTVTGASQKSTQATASFKVETGLKLTISTPQNVIIGSVAPINLEITKPNYTDQFSVRYDLVKPYPTYTGAGTIEGMTEGVASEMNGGVRTLRYMPTIAGKTRLMITVTDKTGKTVSDYVEFNTAAIPVTVSPTVIVCPKDGLLVPITITIPNLGPAGKCEFSYTFCDKNGDPNTADGTGMLFYNGWEYHPRRLMEVDKGQTYSFEYDARGRSGNYWIRFDLIDSYGITASRIVNVIHQ